MFFITTVTLFTCTLIQQTPKEWHDKTLQKVDREAITELCSFAPEPLPKSAQWILHGETSIPNWENYIGKVVVVQSWSSASGNGRLAIKTAAKAVSESTDPEDVVLLTIHIPRGSDLAKKYIDKKKITQPVLIDSTGVVCNALGFYKHASNIVIDKNGAVQHVGLGAKGLISAIDDLLAKPHDPSITPETFTPSKSNTTKAVKYPSHSKNFGKSKNIQGKRAPKFHVGEWVANETDVSGRVRVVEFWATWCPPCRKNIPHLNELSKHFGEDVAFVGVTAENKTVVEAFMKKTPMEYGVAVDPRKKMQTEVRCTAIPLAIVISSDGVVRWQGNPSYLTKEIIQQVLSVDRGETVPTKRGRWDTSANHG